MTTRTRTRQRAARLVAGAALALATTATVAACSGGEASPQSSSAGSDSGGATRDFATADQDAPAASSLDRRGSLESESFSAVQRGARAPAEQAADLTLEEKVVSTGSVSLVSDDVADTRFEVQRIVDGYAGQVAESHTETADDGEALRARMVVRVPVADFDDAMDRLEKVADLRSSDQSSDVVTEKYVDLQARVRAQEKSLERVELLFSRAQSIRDIMAIESQLTRRQADLDSLKGQLRALEDRAALSTITVHVERTERATPREEKDDEDGFVAGLAAGWSALTATAAALATVAGALLPFAIVLAVLGVPAWLLVRRLRRGRPVPDPAPAD